MIISEVILIKLFFLKEAGAIIGKGGVNINFLRKTVSSLI